MRKSTNRALGIIGIAIVGWAVKSGCCWIIWQAMHSWRAARQAISGSKQRGRPRAGWFEPLSRQKLDSLTSQEAAVSQDRFRQSYFR